MAFPPKKQGVGVMIAIGKPKAAPPPLDTPGKKPAPAMAEDEATESPEEEQGEDYATRLLSDMTRPLTDAGLSDEEAKGILADIFEATAKCLRGNGETMGQQYQQEHSEQLGGEEEYGR